uniref:Uncharacterized protein n=1 Tax=Solanum tuberosum TaxID=4113 RepID=M1DT73_SOLTU
MPRTRSMASLKNSTSSSSIKVNILSLSSDSSDESLVYTTFPIKRKVSSSKKKNLKKHLSNASGSLSPEDMQRFRDSVKARPEAVKPTKISAESAALLMQDNDELKTRILALERGLKTLHDVVEKWVPGDYEDGFDPWYGPA